MSDSAGEIPQYADEEECDVCGDAIDITMPGYYKSANDEVFRHGICHEEGEAPDGYVFEATDTEKACTNRKYNCGHMIFAPPVEHPQVCPECNDLEYTGDGWEVSA